MRLIINHQSYEITDNPAQMLLWALRDELGLTGTKFGCGAGICGACTVHVDGVPTRSCITPVVVVEGKEITTIEGLSIAVSDTETQHHPVQQAFLETQVPQCSWCMSGQMMTAAALLNENPNPTPAEVVEAMSRNYCRCGCYVRIKKAIIKASELAQALPVRSPKLP